MKRLRNSIGAAVKLPTKRLLFTSLGVLILSLVVYNSKDALFGAPLAIKAAKDGATLTTQFLPITGSAKHARELMINGREVAFDREGRFEDGVLLSPGYNIIEVALRDQFGNKKVKTYHVVLDTPPAVAVAHAIPYQ